MTRSWSAHALSSSRVVMNLMSAFCGSESTMGSIAQARGPRCPREAQWRPSRALATTLRARIRAVVRADSSRRVYFRTVRLGRGNLNMGRPSRHNPRRTADERRPTGVARRARTPANVPRTRPRSAFTSGARLTQEVDRATPRPDSPVFPTPVEALHRQPWISRRRSLSPCTCGSTRSPCLGRSVTSPETSPTEVRARRDPRTPRASAPRRPLRPFDRCPAFCRHFRALERRRARPHPPALGAPKPTSFPLLRSPIPQFSSRRSSRTSTRAWWSSTTTAAPTPRPRRCTTGRPSTPAR